jgi:8-oxo-dGTP diphosphatase
MPLSSQYFFGAFSVDNVIFGFDGDKLKVLLIKRKEEPFIGDWALPGDLVDPAEDLRHAPQRILKMLTGLEDVFLEQVFTFGKVNRHPKGRVITVAYFSLVNINKVTPVASSFAEEVAWHPIVEIDVLAFDHKEILTKCYSRLKQYVRQRPIGFELLPNAFTLSQLQALYEAVLEKPLDKRNFRKKMLSMKILVDVRQTQTGVAHRPAKLYRFDDDRYEQFLAGGFSFEI